MSSHDRDELLDRGSAPLSWDRASVYTTSLLKRLVSKQSPRYLKDNDLLSDLQSTYRAHHSTETAVLKGLSDILSAMDTGNIAMLTLLELLAAFDSVDHNTLLQWWRKSWWEGHRLVYVVSQRLQPLALAWYLNVASHCCLGCLRLHRRRRHRRQSVFCMV